MKKTTLLIAFTVLVLMALLVTSACKAAPTPAMKLRATTNVPATQPPARAMKYWGDLVTERTGGRISFEYLWGGALTKGGEELEAVQRGVANAGFYSVGYYPAKMILNGISYVTPFNTTDPRLLVKIWEKTIEKAPEIVAEVEQYNQKYMFGLPFPSYEMQSVKPVKTLADLKGLKVAVIGANMPKWFEAIGATPVAMIVVDRYTAFQTRLIDAGIMPLPMADPMAWTDFAKNCTLVTLGGIVLGPVVMNTDDWKKLSSKDQKIVMDAAKEAAKWNADFLAEEVAKVKAKWVGLGVTFYELSDADRMAWAEALKYMPYDWAAEWDKKGLAATKTLEAWLKAAEELGHKYPIKWAKR